MIYIVFHFRVIYAILSRFYCKHIQMDNYIYSHVNVYFTFINYFIMGEKSRDCIRFSSFESVDLNDVHIRTFTD